jgi:DNA-binding PadR family transcriptional regulator
MGILRPEERQIIEHSLGLGRAKESYRNHFCAGDDHSDMPQINSLVQLGFMRASHKINGGRDTIYVVTDAGKAALNKTV